MLKYPIIDAYVPLDGEIGFSNIVKIALPLIDQKNKIRNNVTSQLIDGCITKDANNKVHFSNNISRHNSLDEIPSPYLMGLFDKFFDGKLSPLIQTNRGCPFHCTFCVDGVEEKQKVNQFSMKRVISEINYIGKYVNRKTGLMMIADVNFGMIPRDREICKTIVAIQKKYGYPKKIDCSTGKNSKDRIIEAIKILDGALMIKLSVQSTNKNVLTNVKRSNISIEQMLELVPIIKKSKLSSLCEIIVGLPGDSYENSIKTIKDMISVDIDEYVIYILNLLHGSELSIPSERKKWNYKTKFRILPRSFAKLHNGKKIMETEEIVVGSNNMSFDDYVQLRLLATSLFITNQLPYKPIIKFLRQNNVDVFELFNRPVNSEKNVPNVIKKLMKQIKSDIINELWDTPEKIIKNFQNENEYNKLLNEKTGFNVTRFYNALIIRDHLKDWTEYIILLAKTLFLEKNDSEKHKLEQYQDISNYCRGLTLNILKFVSNQDEPIFIFKYDVKKWNDDITDKKIDKFIFEKTKKIIFKYNNSEINLFQNNMDIYGNSINGIAQVIKRIPKKSIWRKSVIMS